MNIKFITAIFFIVALLVIAPLLSNAQSSEVFTLTKESLQDGKAIALDKLQWKYHAGDDLNWANPNFDDSSWETLNGTILTLENLPKSGWNGIGWFRLRLNVDESLINQQLALIMDHWGASEIYVDGVLVNQFGTVGAGAETEEAYKPNFKPFFFDFRDNRAEHLIAVRHSAAATRDFSQIIAKVGLYNSAGANLAGLEVSLAHSPNAVRDFEKAEKIETIARFLRGGMLLIIGILFLLLYAFYPSRKASLYFSLYSLLLFFNVVSNYVRDSSHNDFHAVVLCGLCGIVTFTSAVWFSLIFSYTEFGGGRIPKYFWFYVLLCVSQLFLQFFSPSSILTAAAVGVLTYSFWAIESFRVMFAAVRRKQSGAWIVFVGSAPGYLLIIVYILMRFFILFGISTQFVNGYLPYWQSASTLGVMLSIAVYLARQFAQTNKNLEAQLIKEVEHEREKTRFAIVEAENERRAKELEEARQLQLSMLPKKLPNIPNLEIAAYMKPATEVGGDYYDFHVSDDGTLTVAVGDATGHGLKAGSVVTATKSLFNAFAKQNDIPQILKEISQALKQMNLRGLFMAMTMLKIKDNQVNFSIAGMPSVLVYRRENNRVEEIAIRAMPLGSFAKTDYREQQITLAGEDVLLLMSDGFPEMFNQSNEMLGFGKAAEILPQIAANSAQEIINHLVKVGEDWANGRPQDDDVTFVVLKVKTE